MKTDFFYHKKRRKSRMRRRKQRQLETPGKTKNFMQRSKS
jgi:hypothetical protein